MTERRYGFRFSLTEGCVIVVSVLLASFLIFLFGVYAGKELEAHQAAKHTSTVRLPAPPAEDPARPPEERSALVRPAPVAKPAVAPLPTPGSSLPASKPANPPPSSPSVSLAQRSSAVVLESAPAEKKPAETSFRWSVQVQATRDAEVAQSLARSLREQGYAPVVSKVVKGGEVWYRVRVGSFANEEEARASVARFRRDGKFAQAYPVSE
jgi:cell division septation protein DedD